MRHWREEAGLSQQELARLSGLDVGTIRRLERGENVYVRSLLSALEVLQRPPGAVWTEPPGEGKEPKPLREPRRLRLGPTQEKIIDFLGKQRGPWRGTVEQLAERLHLSWEGAYRALQRLRKREVLTIRSEGWGTGRRITIRLQIETEASDQALG